MQDAGNHLEVITEKLQHLAKRHLQLKNENLQLKKDIEKYERELAQQKEQVNTLQQTIDVLKIGGQNWSEEEKRILEKRLEIYLREIEKCLQLLHS